MWQYIPEAAVKYGLKVGPVVDLQLPDPGDERHRVDLPTKARYLKDLYSTDAQASVLLVMASYNRSEDQVLPLIRTMPANPKDHRFLNAMSNIQQQVYPNNSPAPHFKCTFFGRLPELGGCESEKLAFDGQTLEGGKSGKFVATLSPGAVR